MDLNAVVAEAQGMLERLIGEHIVLSAELDPDAGYVRADPGQVEQIVLNLVLNARDAIGARGGRIVVSTKGSVARDAEKAYCVLQVEDDGPGMSDEVKSHLFEPFFTTKPRGQGTGLGLATVYGIVQQASGQVSVRSTEGKGTTIEVRLPASSGVASLPRASSLREEERARGEETILLVEDEAPLRRVIREVLSDSGYEVVEAADGFEAMSAIARLAEDGRPIDLVLSDMVMPGPGGRQLAAAVREKWPEARVLLMSGYDEDAEEGRSGADSWASRSLRGRSRVGSARSSGAPRPRRASDGRTARRRPASSRLPRRPNVSSSRATSHGSRRRAPLGRTLAAKNQCEWQMRVNAHMIASRGITA